jgi:hypothetical protein
VTTEQLLREIGGRAFAAGNVLSEKQRALALFEAATPFDGAVRWTEYRRGVFQTKDGAVREAPWPQLGDEMRAYARRVVPKGGGWWFTGAVSTNGGCRDSDIESVTMLILDADDAGEWDMLRGVLEEARLAHIAQRSSSHTPEAPKWHLLVPLARPWTGKKHEWRCIWRFLVGWFSAAGGLRCNVDGDPPAYGFDPKTDRLGQPSFPAAKRAAGQPPPETITTTGHALDLDTLLERAGFDRAWFAAAAVASPEPDRPKCTPEHGLLALAFAEAGMLRHRIERGDARGFAVVCPTTHLHTGPRHDRDDSSMVFDPRPGSTKGYLHCKHRCGDRTPDDALKLLPTEAVERARKKWRALHQGAERAADAVVRPKIVINHEEEEINNAAVAALLGREDVYQRSGALVHVVLDSVTGGPAVTEIALPTLREILAGCIEWRRLQEVEADVFEERPTHPPDWSIRAVHAREVWSGMRPLVGVVETPTLRRDGSVLQTPGYDKATGLLYRSTGEFPAVAEAPTLEDAERARDELLEVVNDFPFAAKAHRAAWMALVLTVFARTAIDGCVPMAALDAATPGTGKGMLSDVLSILATGRDASKTPLPSDDDEMRKRITSLLVEGEMLIFLDNIARPLGYPSLDACITATVWKDRALGNNRTITVPNLALWIATGNNLQFAGDSARRVLHIRLESNVEKPEDRTDFMHPLLLPWVRRERGRLVTAALTILRAYFVAGCPDMKAKSWGGFESWSRLIASCVMWMGMEDPQKTRIALTEQSDPVRDSLHGVLCGWKRLQESCHLAPGDGLSLGQVLRALYPAPTRMPGPPEPPFYEELREALETMVAPIAPGKPPAAQKLGMHLHHVRKRIAGGMMLDRARIERGGVKWLVISAGEEPVPKEVRVSPASPASSLSEVAYDTAERAAIHDECGPS